MGDLMKKKCMNERIEEAEQICKKNPLKGNFEDCYKTVRSHVQSCLNEVCKKSGYDGNKIEYTMIDANLKERKIKSDGECFFIQFTSDGYVVVVGAGYDYGLPQNDKYLNVKILNCLKKQWSNSAILVFMKGIRPVNGRYGAGQDILCKHLLQCRNGVEMYIGEYLLEKEVPILNKHSHKNYNYTRDEWKEKVEGIIKTKN